MFSALPFIKAALFSLQDCSTLESLSRPPALHSCAGNSSPLSPSDHATVGIGHRYTVTYHERSSPMKRSFGSKVFNASVPSSVAQPHALVQVGGYPQALKMQVGAFDVLVRLR